MAITFNTETNNFIDKSMQPTHMAMIFFVVQDGAIKDMNTTAQATEVG